MLLLVHGLGWHSLAAVMLTHCRYCYEYILTLGQGLCCYVKFIFSICPPFRIFFPLSPPTPLSTTRKELRWTTTSSSTPAPRAASATTATKRRPLLWKPYHAQHLHRLAVKHNPYSGSYFTRRAASTTPATKRVPFSGRYIKTPLSIYNSYR